MQYKLLHSSQISNPHCTLVDISSTNCSVEPTNQNLWSLYFVSSNRKDGALAGCKLIDLCGNHTQLSCHLESKCLENIAKYEALRQGLRKSIDFNVKCIEVFGDSKVVLKQVRNSIECNSYHLKISLQEVWNLMYKFEEFNIKSITYIKNYDTDMLTNSTSNNEPIHDRFSIELICKTSISNNN